MSKLRLSGSFNNELAYRKSAKKTTPSEMSVQPRQYNTTAPHDVNHQWQLLNWTFCLNRLYKQNYFPNLNTEIFHFIKNFKISSRFNSFEIFDEEIEKKMYHFRINTWTFYKYMFNIVYFKALFFSIDSSNSKIHIWNLMQSMFLFRKYNLIFRMYVFCLISYMANKSLNEKYNLKSSAENI